VHNLNICSGVEYGTVLLIQVFEEISNWGKSWQGVEKGEILGRYNLQTFLPPHVNKKDNSRQR
jgi:hypothetical protein